MTEVIQFKHKDEEEQRQDIVWQCGCGEQEFNLFGDGDIVCLACESLQKFRWFDPNER